MFLCIETFDEIVRWVCDYCEEKRVNQSTMHENDAVPAQTREYTVQENVKGLSGVGAEKNDIQTEEHVYKDDPQQSHDACTNLDSVERDESAGDCEVGKNRKRSFKESNVEKVDIITHGRSESDSTLNKLIKKMIHKRNRRKDEKKLPIKVTENKGSDRRVEKCISSKPLDSDTNPGQAEHLIISCDGSSKISKKKKTVRSSKISKKKKKKNIRSSEAKGLGLENLSAMRTEDRESEDSEERTSTTTQHTSNFPKDSSISSAEPVFMPTWRGSLNIWNKKHDILDGLIAHMSNKACQKVYDATCQFPPILDLEMLPKSDIWPKSFQTSEPSGDNIALYFFPSKMSEQVFDHLVEEMMKSELALKACINNAELLIFTSTELPLLYWRFQGKYYLWGVFRGKESPPSQSHSSTVELGDETVTHTDLPKDTGPKGGKIPAATKRCGDRSPLSPLSNSASYGSSTF